MLVSSLVLFFLIYATGLVRVWRNAGAGAGISAWEARPGVQHFCFFGPAALFWWGIAHGRYGRAGYGAAVVYVFATAVHGGVLGALLTFSPHVWYSPYLIPRGGTLTPLEDQQLA